jgi:hypothetical protein
MSPPTKSNNDLLFKQRHASTQASTRNKKSFTQNLASDFRPDSNHTIFRGIKMNETKPSMPFDLKSDNKDRGLFISTDLRELAPSETHEFLKRSPDKKTPNIRDQRKLYKQEAKEIEKRACDMCCV